ncbi:MAG: PKD-like domain-containing protein, partial [Bacteroidota bacterium]
MSISFFLFFFLSISGKSQSPVIVANGSTTFCYGGKVTLSVSNAPSGVSYMWLQNGIALNDSVRSELVVTSSGVYRVVLDNGSVKDTLTGIQVNVNRPDANLNGNGATTINGDRYFKVCAANAQNFTFTNGSSTSSTNTNYIIRWGDGTPDYTSTSFNSPINHLYGVGIKTLTFIVYSGTCVDSAQYKVFVGNIPAGGLVGVGGSTICSGNEQRFVIAGTGNNPPGTMYIMFYNDGSKRDTFYHPAPDTVTHIFPKTSCGTNSSNGTNNFPNSYGAFLSIVNPCGVAGGSILPIYVSDKPKAEMRVSPNDTTCINQITTITNITKDTRNVENGVCSTIKFVWRIKALSTGGAWTITSGSLGNDFGSGDPNLWIAGTLNLGVRFTVVGTYSVKLVMINNTLCGADSTEKIICVNPQPTASFTTNTQAGCAPLSVSAIGTTNTPLCGENTFNWSVIYTPTTGCGPAVSSFQYINGTTANSQNPQIRFNNPGVYRLRLTTTSPRGSCTSTATEVQITVKGKPVLNINSPAAVCQGVQFRPSATASCYTAGATYSWQLTGATPSSFNSLVADNVVYNNSGNYSIQLSATNECGTTDSVKPILVRPEPIVTKPSDVQVCHNNTVNAITLTGIPTGLTYTWTNSLPGIGLAASGTGNIPSFRAVNTGTSPLTATISIIPSASGCIGKTTTYTITVYPLPVAPTVQNVTYCQNDAAASLNATALPGNVLYWYTTTTGGTPILVAPVPSTSTPGSTIYYVSQYNPVTNCESNRAPLTVVVNPILQLSNQTITTCSNAPISFTHPSAPAGTVYGWTITTLPTQVSGANNGTGLLSVTDTLKNNSSVNQTVVYSVIPTAAGCPGTSFLLTINLQPKSVISDKTTTLCTGAVFEWAGQNNTGGDIVPAGTLYSWLNPVSNPVGAITGGSASINPLSKINQTLNNTTDKTATLTYKVAAISGSCVSDSFNIVVSVNPKPVIPTQNTTVCSR